MPERIYLASSWRNPYQAEVLAALRAAGHAVYDFKNPAPGISGFGWRQCGDPPPEVNEQGKMRPAEWRRVLNHPRAREGFALDYGRPAPGDTPLGMRWATVGVLLLPCGNSAHLELGWLIGSGLPCFVYCPPEVEWVEPELMHLLAHPTSGSETTICLTMAELLNRLEDARRFPLFRADGSLR
jgi:hypothetical protein